MEKTENGMNYQEKKDSLNQYLDTFTKDQQERKNLQKLWLLSGFPEIKIRKGVIPRYNYKNNIIELPPAKDSEEAKVNLFEELSHSKQTRSLQSPFMPSYKEGSIINKEGRLGSTLAPVLIAAISKKPSLLKTLKLLGISKAAHKGADIAFNRQKNRENILDDVIIKDLKERHQTGAIKPHDIPGTYEYMAHNKLHGQPDDAIYGTPYKTQRTTGKFKDMQSEGISGMIKNQYEILSNPNANKNMITKAIANIKFLLKDSSDQIKITRALKKRLDKQYDTKTVMEKIKEFKRIWKESNQ